MNEWLRELLALPEQGSTVAAEVDQLHYFVIGVTMFGAAAVALVAAIFLIRYRRRRDREPERAEWFEMSLKLEIGLIGALIVLFFWWWWIGVRQYMRIQIPPADATEIYVLAKQWMFKFSYPEGNSSVSTLYVPAGRPVKLVMTSRDVIHDFYVPEFRVKQDIVPGMVTTIWFEVPEPGTYPILCAEFCGTGHSEMRGEVVALAPSDYAAWLEDANELVDVGLAVAADHGCLRCHTTDGTPHIGPSFADLYGATIPLEDGEYVIADEAYLTQSMMDPLARLHRGYQPVMPSYKGLLEAPETAALLELIKSLREGQEADYPPAQAEGLPRYPDARAGEEVSP